MTFEVDNTTQLLLKELQGSMEGTISSVRDAQDEVKDILESMKDTLSDTASADQLSELKNDVLDAENRSGRGLSSAVENVQESLSRVEDRLKDLADKEMFGALEEQVSKYSQFISEFKGQLLKVNTDILRKQTVSSEELLNVLSAITQAIKLEEKKFEEEMWTAQKNSDEIKAAIEKTAVRKDIADAVQSLQKNIYAFTNKLQANYTASVIGKLDEIIGKLDEYDSALSGLKNDVTEGAGSLALKIDDISRTELKNGLILEAVSAYLSLPGYKRFFKGMEAVDLSKYRDDSKDSP